MEFNFDISKYLAKDTSVKSQMLKVNNNFAKIRQTRKHIQDNCFAFPFADIYIILKVNSDQTYDLVKSGGDEYEFSYTDMGEKVANNLFKIDGRASGEQQSLDHVPSLNGGGGTADVGDSVQVGFYDSSRQKPYIRRIVKRGSITVDPGVPPVGPPTAATGVWPQALGNIQKTGLGYSNLDYASAILPPFEGGIIGWHSKLEYTTSPRRVSSDDLLWPTVLISTEKHLKEGSSTEYVEEAKRSTLIVASHNTSVDQTTTTLRLFGINGDSETDNRTEITSIDVTSFPLTVFTGIETPLFSGTIGSPMGSGYLKTYDLNGQISCTLIQPMILNGNGVVPGGDITTTSHTEYETIVEYEAILIHSLEEIPNELGIIKVESDNGDIVYTSGTLEDAETGVFPPVYYYNEEDNTITITTPNESYENAQLVVKYLTASGSEDLTFKVFEFILDRTTPNFKSRYSQIPPSRINASLDQDIGVWKWAGFMGPSHISVADFAMIQAHPAAEKVTFSRLEDIGSFDFLGWVPKAAMPWDQMLPMDADGTPRHNYPWQFCRMNKFSNFTPAKYKDTHHIPQTGGQPITILNPNSEMTDGFAFPAFSIWQEKYSPAEDSYGNIDGIFKSYLWLIRARVLPFIEGEAVFTESFKILQRDSPTPGSPQTLLSLATASMAASKASIESSLDIVMDHLYSVERNYNYSCYDKLITCPNNSGAPVSGLNYIGPKDCSDPCFNALTCDLTPESSGCVCWELQEHSLYLGQNDNITLWKGFLVGEVTDFYGVTYPQGFPQEKDGLANILLPLPAGLPNNTPPDFGRCTWTSYSKGSANIFTDGKIPIDPQVVIDPLSGTMYMCFIEGSFLYVPTGEAFGITSASNSDIPGPEDVEEGMVLCQEIYNHAYSFVVTGGCDRCNEGPYDVNGPGTGGYFDDGRYIEGAAFHLPSNQVPGSSYIEYSYYSTTEVKEVRQTKLAIINKEGTSSQIIPISRKFTGVPYSNVVLNEFAIEEELPVPENVWQLGIAKGVLIILRDDRENFRDSARPILEIRNLANGEIITTYKGLIPDDLYEEQFTEDTGGHYIGECKWNLHGKIDSGTGDCQGPKFKIAWSGLDSDPAYIHVSAEMWEKKFAENYKTRTEYRILALTPTSITEVRSKFEEITLEPSDFLTFSSNVPRPNNLMSMAESLEETFIPQAVWAQNNGPVTWKIQSNKET